MTRSGADPARREPGRALADFLRAGLLAVLRDVADARGDAEVSFSPVLVVDGETVKATPSQLSGASVTARVVGETKGPKVVGFTYKSKANQRRRWGHRQRYSTVEITKITKG